MRYSPPSRLGLGTAPLGNLYAEVSEEGAAATIAAGLGGWHPGVRHRAALRPRSRRTAPRGGALGSRPRDEFVLSTKVGRLLVPGTPDGADGFTVSHGQVPRFDFSAQAVRRSLEESLERLGLDRVDVVAHPRPRQPLGTGDHRGGARAGRTAR